MKIFKLADLYMKKRVEMNRDNGYMDNVMNGFLDCDRIHLSHLGTIFSDTGLSVHQSLQLLVDQ